MDFSNLFSVTTYQEFEDLVDQDKIDEFISNFNDRTICYYVREKNRTQVKTILDAGSTAIFETHYILINEPAKSTGATWGTIVMLDPAKHSTIEQAIYDNDGTILEPDRANYRATKARLEG